MVSTLLQRDTSCQAVLEFRDGLLTMTLRPWKKCSRPRMTRRLRESVKVDLNFAKWDKKARI